MQDKFFNQCSFIVSFKRLYVLRICMEKKRVGRHFGYFSVKDFEIKFLLK